MNSPVLTSEPSPSFVLQHQASAVAFVPLGTRISDWFLSKHILMHGLFISYGNRCYTGTLDSSPPVVKADELYDIVRHIGRGSYGDVNLVKNVEDNKL